MGRCTDFWDTSLLLLHPKIELKKKCVMISLLFICAILIACGDLFVGYMDALNK